MRQTICIAALGGALMVSGFALPAAAVPVGTGGVAAVNEAAAGAARGVVAPVHSRRFRHCHWRHGHRHCHRWGGYGYSGGYWGGGVAIYPGYRWGRHRHHGHHHGGMHRGGRHHGRH